MLLMAIFSMLAQYKMAVKFYLHIKKRDVF